jgi:hypothetical protein
MTIPAHDPAQTTAQEPASTFYPARHAALTAESRAVSKRAYRLRIALQFLAVLTCIPLIRALRETSPAWPILIPLLLAAVVLNLYLRTRGQRDRLARLLKMYDRAMGRLDGTVPQSGHMGEAFRTPDHLFDRDLTILGPDSIFGLLATVRTGVGQRGLAHHLLHLPERAATLERQRAIKELAPRNDLREQIYLLGANDFQQVPAAFFDSWLDDPAPVFHPALRYLLYATTTLLLLLLGAGLWHFASWAALMPNLFDVLAVQSAVAMYLRSRVLPVLNGAANLSNQIQMFRDGIALLQSTVFAAPKLISLQENSREPANAVALLKKLQSQIVVVEQRTKEWFLLASLLLCAGTHAAIAIANWKRQHAAAMKHWLATWGEFEALNALATFAYEHPAYVYPEILATGTGIFEATALAHPLLPSGAVANDIALNDTARLLLISGSNMAGKSTLLRSIGLNAVLAANGAPVRATSARISPMQLGASLALTDSLAEGKSKFLAEVERLHAILRVAETASGVPILFLIDEIFSGTNSVDRRIAAEAVARALIEQHAIGALSTHDLTLTEMAVNPSLAAVNVHMASPDPADPLAFDYRLKPGVNPSSNALAILRLIGIRTDV